MTQDGDCISTGFESIETGVIGTTSDGWVTLDGADDGPRWARFMAINDASGELVIDTWVSVSEGTGVVDSPPSGTNAAYWAVSTALINLNEPATEVSLQYASGADWTLVAYSGPDATGTPVLTVPLPANASNIPFADFDLAEGASLGEPFASIAIEGPAGFGVIDDLTFCYAGLDPGAAIDALVDDVVGLVADGELGLFKAIPLLVLAGGAGAAYDGGHEALTVALLQGFAAVADLYGALGILDASTAQGLVDAALAIIDALAG